jgi:hypothetical protein
MDDRLKAALEFSTYRINFFNLKESIKRKVDSMLTYSINGGIFKVTLELMNFVDLMIRLEKPFVVLIDMNGNPIEINDLAAFQEAITELYFQATNFYHFEYQKLKKARAVHDQFDGIFKD